MMWQPDGFIEVIEEGQFFFHVLKAFLASILSSLLQVLSSYLKSYLSADFLTSNPKLGVCQ